MDRRDKPSVTTDKQAHRWVPYLNLECCDVCGIVRSVTQEKTQCIDARVVIYDTTGKTYWCEENGIGSTSRFYATIYERNEALRLKRLNGPERPLSLEPVPSDHVPTLKARIAKLEKRRDDLLRANNQEVERRRAAEFERDAIKSDWHEAIRVAISVAARQIEAKLMGTVAAKHRAALRECRDAINELLHNPGGAHALCRAADAKNAARELLARWE